MKEALIIVDAQKDFMPGGSLAVTDGDKIIPIINELLPQYDLVIFTKDWHTEDNIYFASTHEGKNPFDQMEINGKVETLWPDHCLQDQTGSDIHDDINLSLINGDFYIFKKGYESNWHPYGAFGDKIKDTGLEKFLKERGVTDLMVVGLALDFCVKDTAVDAAKRGFNTTVKLEGTRAIMPDTSPTLKEFEENNVKII